MTLSPLLQAVLLAMIVGSASFFILRFGSVIWRILRCRPSRNVGSAGITHGLWTLFWEGLCQAKVIRQRPLPGIAHAFLLWSFCAFLLAEVNHLAAGFDMPFLKLESPLGLLYFWFVFLFALCCTIAVAGLAVRRYIVRSEWLDPGSYQTATVLLLIFIVMITLLPRWWVEEGSRIANALWWTHTVALLALLAFIPRSKNLHILLSPFSLFLKPASLGRLAPLDKIEPSLRTGRDITRRNALQAYSCVECGRCTEQCPAYATGKELDPRLIALGMSYYLDEYGPKSQLPILDVAIRPEAVFQCTTCGACEESCPVGVELLPMIVGLRRGALVAGKWSHKDATKLFANLEQNGNAIGAPQTERDGFIRWRHLPVFDGSQEYCLWLGCLGSYDPRGQEIIEAFASVMEHLGTSFGVLRKEYCTGDPARRLGNEALFGGLATSNLEILRRANVKKIVSICPHCVRTMAEDWNRPTPGEQLDATIEHHSEFLARFAERLPDFQTQRRVVFHDPCYLGRYRGIYAEPRRVIARTCQVFDSPQTGKNASCCGAGGGLVFLGGESGQSMSEARVALLLSTEPDVVVSACPFCAGTFREVFDQAAGQMPRLMDIAQIVAEQLPSARQ